MTTDILGYGVMETRISKSRFRKRAVKIPRRVELSGEPVVITDRGAPKLILKRYSTVLPAPEARLKGVVLHYSNPFEPVGERDWEAMK